MYVPLRGSFLFPIWVLREKNSENLEHTKIAKFWRGRHKI